MPIVATEAGYWNADVLGINDTECLEIEVKVSVSDMRADRHKAKHDRYGEIPLESLPTRYNGPNRFYYLVPVEMQEQALCFAAEMNPKYGVILCTNYEAISYRCHEHLSVCKRAMPLHNNKPSETLKNIIIKRMSSELAGYYVRDQLQGNVILEAIRGLESNKDIEANETGAIAGGSDEN